MEKPNLKIGVDVSGNEQFHPDKKYCFEWRLNHYNVFWVTEDGLSGVTGNFREGGYCKTTSLEDLADSTINLGWIGNSIFCFVEHGDPELVENSKKEMIDCAKYILGVEAETQRIAEAKLRERAIEIALMNPEAQASLMVAIREAQEKALSSIIK